MAQRVNTSAKEISTANTSEQDLPNIVRYWILRLLVDLKVDQHFIKRHGQPNRARRVCQRRLRRR